MKKQWRKLLALALALCMVSAAAACSLKEEAPAETESDASRDEIAVRVGSGDEDVITRGEIEDGYESQVSMYQAYGMAAPTAAADVESMQDQVVDTLVSGKLLLYKAGQMGVTLDKEAQDGVDADLEDEIAYYMENFRAQAESEGAADVEERAIAIFNEQLKSAGLDMDVDGYREYVRGFLEEEAIAALVEEKVKSEVSATDEEVQTYYDDLLAKQKETYAATPEDYLDDMESFEKFGGDPVLITPEGYVRVRTITISPAEDISEDYNTLKTEMTALEAEYGQLALAGAAMNAARLTEITKEYNAKKAEAEKLYETYVSAAREKAQKAYAALEEGKSFSDVLAEYGEDDVYTTFPAFRNTGLLMQKGVASSTWKQELVDAVAKLNPGEYTAVIPVDDAYEDDMFYICELVGDEPAGETPFSDVSEEIREQATAEKAETHWSEQQAGWLNETGTVTYYEDVYRSIGK